MASRLFLPDARQLHFRRGFRHEIIHAGLRRNGSGGQGIVPRHHDGAYAHGPETGEAFLDASLDNVFQINDAQHVPSPGYNQRGSSCAGYVLDGHLHFLRESPALLLHPLRYAFRRAFADGDGRLAVMPGNVHAAHARGGGERDKGDMFGIHVASPDAEQLLGQYDDAAAFRRFIGQGGKLGGFRQLLFLHAGSGQEFIRHTVAEGDGAGLVQHQHVDVPGRFHGAARRSQHIPAHQTVNAADADGAQQAADRRRNQAHQQGDQNRQGNMAIRTEAELPRGILNVPGHGWQGKHHGNENDGQRRQQNAQRDFIGRPLTAGAFHHGNHAVQEGIARLRRDADDNAVADHAGAARHGAAVAAAFPDDRGGFARNGGLVHAGNAFNHFAVKRNDVPCFAQHLLSLAQFGNGNDFLRSLVRQQAGVDVHAHFFQSVRLGLSTPFRPCFRKIGEQDREPEPERNLQGKAERLPRGHVPDKDDSGDQGAQGRDKYHKVFGQGARIEFAQCVPESRFQHGLVAPECIFLFFSHHLEI